MFERKNTGYLTLEEFNPLGPQQVHVMLDSLMRQIIEHHAIFLITTPVKDEEVETRIVGEKASMLQVVRRWQAEAIAMAQDPAYTPDLNSPQLVLDLINTVGSLLAEAQYLKQRLDSYRLKESLSSLIEAMAEATKKVEQPPSATH